MLSKQWFVVFCLVIFFLLPFHRKIIEGFSDVAKNDHDELSRGLDRVRQLARHFDVVHVDTTDHYDFLRRRRRGINLHPSSSTFSVPVFGKTYNLDVELNDYLLPAGHVTRSFADNGQEVIEKGAVNCYYQGQIRGESNSHAVLSTCDGLSGSFGEGPAGHWTSDKTFFIEPLTRRPQANGSHFHAVFGISDTHDYNEERTCGVDSDIHERKYNYSSYPFQDLGDGERFSVNITDQPRVERSKRDVHTETKYIELMIVADHSVFVRQGRNTKTVADRARLIANFVDTVYKPLNVRVPLVAVEVWSQADRIPVVSNVGTLLKNFLSYRSSQLVKKHHHDNAQLISGISMKNSVGGVAPLGGMCSRLSSGGINKDSYPSAFAFVAGSMAHEMGHTLGMKHDVSGRCTCRQNTAANGCIMEAKRNFVSPTVWSSCSRAYLKTFLSGGGGFCLFNTPTKLFGPPVCGNGFVEAGEQCDCGTVANCNDPCCDAKTCRLSAGSQCSNGECCQNCRFKAMDTLCRRKVNSCDLPETCSGLSGTCPRNLFVQNGMPCRIASSASYCYNGMCKTRDQQCLSIWGATSRGSSPAMCYASTNIKGDRNGNCGKTSRGFIKCSWGDVFCGTLFCSGGPYRPVISGVSYRSFDVQYGSTVCKGVGLLPGQDETGLGQVDDGTICAINSICLDNQCRSINSLGITPCPSNGGKVCSGNGACTNLNTCLCNKGWTGTDCSRIANSKQKMINKRTSENCMDSCLGGWSTWSRWSHCSVTCGRGVQARFRFCTIPSQPRANVRCYGRSRSTRSCAQRVCPVSQTGRRWSGMNWNYWHQ